VYGANCLYLKLFARGDIFISIFNKNKSFIFPTAWRWMGIILNEVIHAAISKNLQNVSLILE
jgi:hypothetical protein